MATNILTLNMTGVEIQVVEMACVQEVKWIKHIHKNVVDNVKQ